MFTSPNIEAHAISEGLMCMPPMISLSSISIASRSNTGGGGGGVIQNSIQIDLSTGFIQVDLSTNFIQETL